VATIVSKSGKQFVVPDEVEADYLAQGFRVPGGEPPSVKSTRAPRSRRRSTPRAQSKTPSPPPEPSTGA